MYTLSWSLALMGLLDSQLETGQQTTGGDSGAGTYHERGKGLSTKHTQHAQRDDKAISYVE